MLLAAHPAVAQLEQFDMGSNNLDADAVQALIDSPHLTDIGRLSIGPGLSRAEHRRPRSYFGERLESPHD